MKTARSVVELRQTVRSWREQGHSVALVPTMGNLHAGHLALIDEALRKADRVVASVFVNPTQFGPDEDFEDYPRTLDQDAVALAEAGCHLLFSPSVTEMYPHGTDRTTQVMVPGVSDGLCGAARPGHFQGVATIVAKLFLQVGPDLAVFGEKDYQQLLVIRKMVHDLDLPVDVVAAATVREPDGLALSSRNRYLTPEQRRQAACLFRELQALRDAVVSGDSMDAACKRALQAIAAEGFEPEYLEIRRASDLAEATSSDTDLVALVAARLGQARLIDNLRFRRE